jgi:hypothetical protein
MKFRKLSRWLLPFVAVILVSCATPTAKTPEVTTPEIQREAHKQRVIGLKSHMDAKFRLLDVSYRLTSGATDLCTKKTMYSGFQFITPEFYEGKYKDAAIDLYALGERPKIIHVVENSPADDAGLEVGDEILSIEGKPLPTSPEKVREIMTSLPDTAVSLQMMIMRNGQQLPIKVHRKECCDYGVVLVPGDMVNAWADGRRVFVTKGMMRYVENDLELATIMSHELAHNVRGHVEMTKKHQMVGGFFGLLLDIGAAVAGVNTSGEFTRMGMQAARQMYSKDMEREADYVGMYILALSGYDFHESPDVFRKFGSSHPGSIETKYASSHPSTPERFIAMEKAVEEINIKKAKGIALVPEEEKTVVASRNSEKESEYVDSDPYPRPSKKPKTREEQLAHVMKEVRDTHEIRRTGLRSTPKPLWDPDIEAMIGKYNFFIKYKNDKGHYQNDYVDNGDGTITDKATGLMWQKGGSSSAMRYWNAKRYVSRLNKERFSGHGDWRIPTTEELASLLERDRNNKGLHISPVFGGRQKECWTSDTAPSSVPALTFNNAIDFFDGSIDLTKKSYSSVPNLAGYEPDECFIRAVRSIK